VHLDDSRSRRECHLTQTSTALTAFYDPDRGGTPSAKRRAFANGRGIDGVDGQSDDGVQGGSPSSTKVAMRRTIIPTTMAQLNSHFTAGISTQQRRMVNRPPSIRCNFPDYSSSTLNSRSEVSRQDSRSWDGTSPREHFCSCHETLPCSHHF
jgi:hypothetical protein